MGFFDRLKALFGGIFGDIPEIQKLKKQEDDIYNVKEKVAKEELEAVEALLDWARNQDSEVLKNAVELYYSKKKEIIEASKQMIEAIRNDYINPLAEIAENIKTFKEILDNKEKAEKTLEKTEKNLEKKKFDLEKEQSKIEKDLEKINKRKLEVEDAERELVTAEKELQAMNQMVEKTKIDLTKFKFSTLVDAFTKLSEHEKTYLHKFKEIFKIRENLIGIMEKEIQVAILESAKPTIAEEAEEVSEIEPKDEPEIEKEETPEIDE